MAQQDEVSTTTVPRGASKLAATIFLLACLIFGILLGFSGNQTSKNLRAPQAENENFEAPISPLSAPAPEAKENSLNPLKATAKSEESVKAAGNSVGAWGPNDFEKDDWKNLFGADKAGGSVMPFNQLMAADDGDGSLSFSYDFVDTDTDSWFV